MSNDKLEIKEVPPSQIPNVGPNPTKLKYDLIVNIGFKYRNYELRKHLKLYLLEKKYFLIFLGFVIKKIIIKI